MPRGTVVGAMLAVTCLTGTVRGQIRGPSGLPIQLVGIWDISLCVGTTHSWIRFENVETGEVHTCGRYGKGFGGITDKSSGAAVWPAAPAGGVIWDMDLLYEHGVRQDKRVLRVVRVLNPLIYRGLLNGYHHFGVRINCTTYARDAWFFYTGEYYHLPLIASPDALGVQVLNRPLFGGRLAPLGLRTPRAGAALNPKLNGKSRVSAAILDGRALAHEVRRQVATEVADLTARFGVVPGLAVVLVGDDPASQVYVRNKESACKAAGMTGTVVRLPANVFEIDLLAAIDKLNGDPTVHGILVQLPLSAHLAERTVVERVAPHKDVDGFHPFNFGLLARGDPRFVPCTPLGIRQLLDHGGVDTRGMHAVILGRSQIVGRPMALLLLQKGEGGDATVTVCHTATRDVAAVARQADLLIVAMGQPERVTGDWIKPGAVVIDVGIHRRDDGRLCGDVHFPSAVAVAARITPVPGGVGPMTIAMLLRNTLQAARISLESSRSEQTAS